MRISLYCVRSRKSRQDVTVQITFVPSEFRISQRADKTQEYDV